MQFEEKDIAYPPVHPGTDRTFIRFYGGEPDLNSIFYSSEEENSPQRIFVTDTNVASLKQIQPFVNFFRGENYSQPKIENGFIGTRGKDVLLILGSGEPFKTIESVLAICKAAIDSNAKRSAVFTGIGGGVITDMTAFAASIFKRGASCEFVPTTLLAMVDAAIGGKTGVNFDKYKNMLGVIRQPEFTYVNSSVLSSLPRRDLLSGAAEMLKTFIICNENDNYRKACDALSREDIDTKELMPLIAAAAGVKAGVVSRDQFESGERRLLNLGHTFAHAIETLCRRAAETSGTSGTSGTPGTPGTSGTEQVTVGKYDVTHGEAVAMGIVLAARLAERFSDRAEKGLAAALEADFRSCGLPVDCPFSMDEMAPVMAKDKKAEGGIVHFVLPWKIGQVTTEDISCSKAAELMK